MNPDDVVSLGPLVLALDRVVALGLFAVFHWAIDRIVRRHGAGGASLGWWALAAGLIAARLDYVVEHRESFALEPLEALRVWLGGWTWFSGVIAALAVLGARLGRTRAMAEAAGVLGLLALVWGGFAENRAAPTPLRLPPDLVFQRLDGSPLRLGDLRGQPVILNLWATWCPPCRRETPMLSRAAAEAGAARVLLVNQGEERAAVQRYLAAEQLPGQAFVLDPSGTLTSLTGSRALPTTLLLDAEGTVQAVHLGEISRVQIDILRRRAQR